MRTDVGIDGVSGGAPRTIDWSRATATSPDDDRCPDDEAKLQKLKTRDAEVRAHEAAHAGAAGGQGGGASFDYQLGPDGKAYAIGGEVPVQLQKGRTPEETIRNAQQVRAAALAPAQPSGQDRAVAAQAAAMESQARNEQQSPDSSPSAAHEAALTTAKLHAERREAYGGYDHAHAPDGCGVCGGRAVNAYRARS